MHPAVPWQAPAKASVVSEPRASRLGRRGQMSGSFGLIGHLFSSHHLVGHVHEGADELVRGSGSS
jgi:hypothetical protein